MIVFIQLRIFGRAAYVLEFHRLQRGLQFNPVEFAIAQEDRLRIGRQNVLELALKLEMHMLWQMPFTAFDHQPGDRQRPFAVQQADQQGDTALPDLAAIDDQHQFADLRQPIEQFLHKGQVIAVIPDPLILDPPAVALHPAVRVGSIRRFFRDGRQLAAFPQHNSAHQRCQRSQHACRMAFGFAWIQLHDRLSNGTIHPTIVTHPLHSCSSVVGKT